MDNLTEQLESFVGLQRPNGFIAPSRRVAETAKALLSSIPNAPEPEVTPDAEGGIDVEWEVGGRQLTLWCNPSGSSLCYREEGGRYAGESADNLAARIQWLVSGS
jgi:hypothetical protein